MRKIIFGLFIMFIVMVGCDMGTMPETGDLTPVVEPVVAESVTLIGTSDTQYTETVTLSYTVTYSDETVVPLTEVFTASAPGVNTFTKTVEGVESNEVSISFEDWRLVGEWIRNENELIHYFNNDGTYKVDEQNGSWSTRNDGTNNRVTVELTGTDDKIYEFIDNDTLYTYWIDGNTDARWVYTRQ